MAAVGWPSPGTLSAPGAGAGTWGWYLGLALAREWGMERPHGTEHREMDGTPPSHPWHSELAEVSQSP